MKEKIIEILKEFVIDDSKKFFINGSTHIINDTDIDSIGMINFILKLEDAFSIEIDYENFDFSYVTSVDKLCEFLSMQNKV